MLRTPDKLFLTAEDFFILAEISGMETFYGMPIADFKALTERIILQKIYDLLNESIVRITDHGIELSDFAEEIFGIICNSNVTLTICSNQKTGNVSCFYLGEKVLMIEQSTHKEDVFELSVFPLSLLKERVNYVYSFPNAQVPGELLDILGDKNDEKMCECKNALEPLEKVMERQETILGAEMVDTRTGNILSRIVILEDPLYPKILYQSAGKEMIAYYNEKLFWKWLLGD